MITVGAPLLTLFEKWLCDAVGSGGFCPYAAGGRIFIFSTCQSFTATGPASARSGPLAEHRTAQIRTLDKY